MVNLSGEENAIINPCLAILNPAPELVKWHGVLIAYSLPHTGTKKTLIHILNFSPAPALVHSHKGVGRLLLLEDDGAVCTLDLLS